MTEVELKQEERQPCEVWTRVMGYFRPVSQFNKGKKSEFYARTYFTEEKALASAKRYQQEKSATENERKN